MYDNRPNFEDVGAGRGIVPHDTPGISLEHADNVLLKHCKIAWGGAQRNEFSYAVEAKDCTGVKIERFTGEAARSELGKAVSIS
jgi:hypothetical protein